MLLFLVVLSAATASGQPARHMPVIGPDAGRAQCPETPMSLARELGKRGPKAVPLNELPPAQTFMAVDRRVDGCPAPLTMIRYRSNRQR